MHFFPWSIDLVRRVYAESEEVADEGCLRQNVAADNCLLLIVPPDLVVSIGMIFPRPF